MVPYIQLIAGLLMKGSEMKQKLTLEFYLKVFYSIQTLFGQQVRQSGC